MEQKQKLYLLEKWDYAANTEFVGTETTTKPDQTQEVVAIMNGESGHVSLNEKALRTWIENVSRDIEEKAIGKTSALARALPQFKEAFKAVRHHKEQHGIAFDTTDLKTPEL